MSRLSIHNLFDDTGSKPVFVSVAAVLQLLVQEFAVVL